MYPVQPNGIFEESLKTKQGYGKSMVGYVMLKSAWPNNMAGLYPTGGGLTLNSVRRVSPSTLPTLADPRKFGSSFGNPCVDPLVP